MKNRKMLLPALLAIFLALSLILPASVAEVSATVHLPDEQWKVSFICSVC